MNAATQCGSRSFETTCKSIAAFTLIGVLLFSYAAIGWAADKRTHPEFSIIWARIVAHQGEKFHTITGLSFAYNIASNKLRVNRAKQNLTAINFKIAYDIVPLLNTQSLPSNVRGASYVYAVLMDRRIRQDDW